MIIAALDVFRLGPGRVRLGDTQFKCIYGCSLPIGIRLAAQLEDGGDMRLILLADLGHFRRVAQVIVAIRHPQTALEQKGCVARGIVQILGDPQAEQIFGI